jgi:hypothetical protein
MSGWIWPLFSRFRAVVNLHLPFLSFVCGRILQFLLNGHQDEKGPQAEAESATFRISAHW